MMNNLWYIKSWLDWASYWVGAIEVYPVAFMFALCIVGAMASLIYVTAVDLSHVSHRFFAPAVSPPAQPGAPVVPQPPASPRRVNTIGFAERPLRRSTSMDAVETPKKRVMNTLNSLARKPYHRRRIKRPINED